MSGEEQARLLQQSAQPVWVLDPLDGTSNFVNGVPYFGVSLALIEDGDVQSGLVYDPVHDEMFEAEKGQGARLNGEPLNVFPASLPLEKGAGIVDYKRLPTELARRLAESPPYSSQRSYGSVALDWCWMAAGRASVYLHGKQNLWDYAAGWLILKEAGGHSCTLNGEPVFNHSLQPRSAVAAADAGIFKSWCDYLGIQVCR
jgi:myo-inositol-1(or 4)-monophosphatase